MVFLSEGLNFKVVPCTHVSASTWELMLRRWPFPFSDSIFSGAMLVSPRGKVLYTVSTRKLLCFNHDSIPWLIYTWSLIWTYMDVSENSGTPKSSILMGLSTINPPFWDTPIFGNTHMYVYIYISLHGWSLKPHLELLRQVRFYTSGQGTKRLQEDLENAQDLKSQLRRQGLVKIQIIWPSRRMIKNWGEIVQPVYSTWKVHGTVPTYWFISTLYQPAIWYLCHRFWP